MSKSFGLRWTGRLMLVVGMLTIVSLIPNEGRGFQKEKGGEEKKSDVGGAYWTAGSDPTIGSIQSQCVEEFPAPRDRTTVGIGEQVNIWVDPETWEDIDYHFDAYGNRTDVYDSIGTITWSVSGDGTIYPLVGSSTTLTTDLTDSDSSVSVSVAVSDAGDFMDDDQGAGQGPLIIFNVVPLGIANIELDQDEPIINGVPLMPAAGNARIAAASTFFYQITPTFVNYNAIQFREGLPAYNLTWPDQTADNRPAGNPVPIGAQNRTINGVTTSNWVLDLVGEPPVTKARLGNPPVAFVFPNGGVPVNLQVYKGVGLGLTWSTFSSTPHPREFTAGLQGRVGIDPGGAAAPFFGGLMGPYQ